MVKWFKVFGWSCIVFGVIGSFIMFGSVQATNHDIEQANIYLSYSEQQETTPLIVSIVPFLVLGFQGCFFFAIAEGLTYLKRTAEASEDSKHELKVMRGEYEKSKAV